MKALSFLQFFGHHPVITCLIPLLLLLPDTRPPLPPFPPPRPLPTLSRDLRFIFLDAAVGGETSKDEAPPPRFRFPRPPKVVNNIILFVWKIDNQNKIL